MPETLSYQIDLNCPIGADVRQKEIGVLWLEEPTFPPEDYAAMADLNRSLSIAAGENLTTAHPFKDLIAAKAVKYPQPSVTKVGGISEFLKVAEIATAAGLTLMPHSPYFGPGYHATLQLCAALAPDALFEYLFIWPEALPDPDTPLPQSGSIAVPTRPGLGFEPSEEILSRYRVA